MTTVQFASSDGLPISADIYQNADNLPWIVLFHQARTSRGEFRETAPEFVKLGFNVLAADLRSGDEVAGIINETAKRAREAKKPTEYLDAEQDIQAAINYTTKLAGKPVIILGSSYSASIALIEANRNKNVVAVLAFSPGEYLGNDYSVKDTIAGLSKPTFITCSKSEVPEVKELASSVSPPALVFFAPTGDGIHGARALWKSTPNSAEYWQAVKSFLAGLKGIR
jgi:dienelactone hydrolase